MIFNRPATTAIVFDKIKQQKPAKLYIAADGAREGNAKDIVNCKLTRNWVIESIDWDCEVKTLFRDHNIGCGKAVSQAISWFFTNEEYGIILEDDTVPDTSFFTFCTEMLVKYQHDHKIMHISGCYFLKDLLPKTPQSYYFTKHIHVWGWATWKRAWENYDYDMQEWPQKKKALKKYFKNYSKFWDKIFELVYTKQIDTWDYQWMFCIFKNNGIALNPTTNLIMNIGFGDEATHTSDENSIFSKIEAGSMLEINHPNKIKIDSLKDDLYYKTYLNVNPKSVELKFKAFLCRILRFLKG
ncbi:MAG: nucleotide-diphospho-sugar transferase [Mucilaginibacter sp.]|nr:nucleotide-diphospho-sugar transferase [Mucilaginibacter sp.]